MAGQLVADLILRNRHFLDSFANGLSGDLIATLQDAQKDILKKLEKPGMNEMTRAHYRAVLAESSSVLKEAYAEMERETLESMSHAAQLEYWAVANAIRLEAGLKKIREDAPNMGLPEKALRNMMEAPVGGYKLADLVDGMQEDYQVMIRYALTQGLVQGQGMATIARNIRRSTGMAMQASRTLARTTVMEASNRALFEVYAENGKYITGYRWLGTLDSRTCMICAHLDGKMHESVDGFPFEPPAHPNCRCVIAPETVFEDKTLERPAKVWDEGKGKYIYEKVPASEGYGEWFARQNEDFQKEYLGARRFELWQSGNLKFGQFVGIKDGQPMPLRLDTLKKRYGIDQTGMKVWREFDKPEDAAKWLKDSYGVSHVYYKGLDPEIFNEMNKALSDIFNQYPNLINEYKYVGNAHRAYYHFWKEKQTQIIKDLESQNIMANSIEGRKRLAEMAMTDKDLWARAKKELIPKKDGRQVWAVTMGDQNKSFKGISFNPYIPIDELKKNLKYAVDVRFHPIGCDTVRSIIDHEIGHTLHHYFEYKGESFDSVALFWRTNLPIMERELSNYAASKNVNEYLAEGWAEFCNNPNPRLFSRMVGTKFVEAMQKFK